MREVIVSYVKLNLISSKAARIPLLISMCRAPSSTVIEIIYHGNITSNIAAGILVRRRFITGRIERAILKRMFRANSGTYFHWTTGEKNCLTTRRSVNFTCSIDAIVSSSRVAINLSINFPHLFVTRLRDA